MGDPPWARAARNLRAPIPEPAKPKVRSAKTWHRLKPGQRLRSTAAVVSGVVVPGGFSGVVVPAGSVWIVDSVNSEGALLVCEGAKLWQTKPEWEALFTRAKHREAPRRKST